MSWRAIQRENFTSLSSLCTFLKLDPTQFQERSPFALNLPKRLAHKIEKGNPKDPILLQFIPQYEEEKIVEGFCSDPVGDNRAKQSERVLRKYKNRALVISTSACAMHCRYCFRRHFDYTPTGPINLAPEINEVILSGGDPLSLSDKNLQILLKDLDRPHVKRIRFHTRFPVGIPERIDSSFLALLESIPQQVYFVVHINHPHELDPILFEHLDEIRRLGIPVLNQSVLLKGVNDSVEVLQRLCEELSDHGVIPYYLHHLDRVQGAAHFEAEGKALMRELAKRLSGYSLPRYVREEAGEPHKTLLPFQS